MSIKDLSYYSMSECLSVQMDGTKVCSHCDLFKTERCGGQDILAKGKNKKGYTVSENGISAKDEPQKTKKKKRR